MSQTDQKIDKLSEILLGFIEKQDNVNTSLEAKIFSVQTLLGAKFDVQSELLLRKLGNLDSKIEDVRYYLESITAQNTNILFEENEELKTQLTRTDDEVANLKSNLYEISLQLRALQKS